MNASVAVIHRLLATGASALLSSHLCRRRCCRVHNVRERKNLQFEVVRGHRNYFSPRMSLGCKLSVSSRGALSNDFVTLSDLPSVPGLRNEWPTDRASPLDSPCTDLALIDLLKKERRKDGRKEGRKVGRKEGGCESEDRVWTVVEGLGVRARKVQWNSKRHTSVSNYKPLRSPSLKLLTSR